MYRDDFVISAALNQPLPTTPQMIIDYMKGQPLDHDPGTVYAYSNSRLQIPEFQRFEPLFLFDFTRCLASMACDEN